VIAITKLRRGAGADQLSDLTLEAGAGPPPPLGFEGFQSPFAAASVCRSALALGSDETH